MEQDATEPGLGRNRLLRLLAETDLELLRPDLEQVRLGTGDTCIEQYRPIEYVYFLESGLSSSVFPDEINGTSELGVQGYEGLIGVPAVLGVDQSPHKVFMQAGGTARRIAVDPLRQAMDRSASLRDLLLRYAHVFLIQTGQTAHVNARFNLEDRLARWLLMAADRLGPRLSLTHEYLSYMLGVRRPGVTNALHILEGKRLIDATRRTIIIRDREGLRAQAGGSYGVPEAEYERVICKQGR
jgi:CRP-like cAMP-binding protein